MSERNILVIGAHSDDCEFCAGGLTLKLVEKGFKVFFVTVIGDNSNWSTVGPEKNEQNIKDSIQTAKVLGAKRITLSYATHEFTRGDVKMKRELVKIIKEINPEIAIIHWANDKWDDHRAVAINSFDTLNWPNTFFPDNFSGGPKEIYAFEAGQCQTFDFYPDFYINITDKMEKIVESFSKFKAMGEGIIKGLEKEKKSLAHNRAVQSYLGEYAEAYVVLKWRAHKISILPQILGNDFKMTNWPKATHEYCR